MEIFYINRLEYMNDDAYILACRQNILYELFCYANTDGKKRFVKISN